MAVNEEVVNEYNQLTAVNRTLDFDVPAFLNLGGELVSVPSRLKEKQVHYLLQDNGSAVRACWIHKAIGHLLNAFRLGTEHVSYKQELENALSFVDNELSSLIKNDLLKNKLYPGAMSFAQTNDNVTPDELVISKRTYDVLVEHNKAWETTKTVSVVRFPNLGPHTTTELRLTVNSVEVEESIDNLWRTLGVRVPELANLLTAEVDEEEIPFVDCFLLHHSILKGHLEGDCDGDTIFIRPLKKGKPRFREIVTTREPGELWADPEDFQTLLKKSNRVEKKELSEWIGPYLDNKPIGPATYAIRWAVYKLLPKFRGQQHPMNLAWQEYAPKAIELIEFVMDIRKGQFTLKQIAQKSNYIKKVTEQLKLAQKDGDWFANTVTSRSIRNVGAFVQRFPTLRSFLKHITEA